jgi:hypothetical protein
LYILRGILRLLKTPTLTERLAAKAPPRAEHQSQLNAQQKFVLETYRKHLNPQQSSHESSNQPSSKVSTQSLQTMAFNYYQMQRDLKERALLYEMDTGAEVVLTPREMSRRAAARSGLQMPEEYSP